MGKIKNGDAVLNTVQVCEKIVSDNIMTEDQREVLKNEVMRHLEELKITRLSDLLHPKKFVARVILDAYKDFNGTDDNSTEARRCLKFLMERYMKSKAIVDNEDEAFLSLLDYWMKD